MNFKDLSSFITWTKTSTFGIVIHTFLFKWYMIIMIPAILAAYYVIKGLEKSGLLDKVETHLNTYLGSLVNIAEHCTPLILNLNSFISCLNNY